MVGQGFLVWYHKKMIKNPYPGKFIVFEGPDGSGKSTQSNLLIESLENQSLEVIAISFPQYGAKSTGLVEEYLSGKYGTAKQVGPYRASIFYACDRYDASFEIKKWLKQGKIVVSNRYVTSSIGHQAGKIENKEKRKKFIKWLYNLEYEIFRIPKPDITFILKLSPEFSERLSVQSIDREVKKQAYLRQSEKDIHENLAHLSDAFDSYLEAAKEFPNDFELIECLENGKLLSPKIIHEKVVKIIQTKLLK